MPLLSASKCFVLLIGIYVAGLIYILNVRPELDRGDQKEMKRISRGTEIRNTYIVSLPGSFKRRMRIIDCIKNSSFLSRINFTIIDGVVGSRVRMDKLAKDGKISRSGLLSVWNRRRVLGEYLTPGAVGCIMSHAKVWLRVIEDNAPALVFEDDVVFSALLDEMLPLALRDVPSTFSMLYLADLVQSAASQKRDSAFDGKWIYRLKGEYWGTYAYVVSPNAAKILYDEIFPLRLQADSYIMEVTKYFGLNVYRTIHNIVNTKNSAARESFTQISHGNKITLAPIRLCVLGDSKIDSNRLYAIKHGLHYVEKKGWKSATRTPLSIHTNCLREVYLHGGICIDSSVYLFRSFASLGGANVAIVATDKQQRLIPGFVFGSKGSQDMKNILHSILLLKNASITEITRVWNDCADRMPLKIKILPFWFLRPLPLAATVGSRTRAIKFDLNQFLLSSSLFGNFAIGISTPYAMPRQIPKTIHMIWLGDKIPLTAYNNILYTISLHPAWKIELWTEKRLLSEMKLLKKQYFKTRDFRQKADLARYEILSRYGGIYVDADFQFYRSLDVLNLNFPIVCHEDGKDLAHISISNGFLGFPPKHPAIRTAVYLAQSSRMNGRYIVRQTGPGFFSRSLRNYMANIQLLPKEMFYPVSYRDRHKLVRMKCYETSCSRYFPNSVAAHLWKVKKVRSEQTVDVNFLIARINEHKKVRIEILQGGKEFKLEA